MKICYRSSSANLINSVVTFNWNIYNVSVPQLILLKVDFYWKNALENQIL